MLESQPTAYFNAITKHMIGRVFKRHPFPQQQAEIHEALRFLHPYVVTHQESPPFDSITFRVSRGDGGQIQPSHIFGVPTSEQPCLTHCIAPSHRVHPLPKTECTMHLPHALATCTVHRALATCTVHGART